jgi:hypothetical protein
MHTQQIYTLYLRRVAVVNTHGEFDVGEFEIDPLNSYTAAARQYAKDVVAGRVPTCKWVRAACQRQLDNLDRFKGKDCPYRFNPKLTDKLGRTYQPADNLGAFIERLAHVKGPLAGQPIHLERWQVFVLSTVFGWVKTDGKRRFRRAYIEVPRGNAKSTLSSALALYMLAADGEGGAEVYSLRTPLMQEDMRFIEFSPYWNVPPSIARKETVPKLRRDPAYLAREGLEFVTPAGQVVTTLVPDQIDAVLRGGWRIRQRPATRHALGDIKFVFPNNDNVYLHDTPSTQLFERERRDFSHGCIRVQSPVALAQFVLWDEPAWTEERIRDAMGKGVSSTLRLKQPVPVLIAYSTVIVKSGTVFFYPDVYGHDRRSCIISSR